MNRRQFKKWYGQHHKKWYFAIPPGSGILAEIQGISGKRETKSMRGKTQIAAVLVLSLAPFARSGNQDRNAATVATITKLINDDVKASLAGDTNFIKINYVDRYVEGTSLGTWMTKEQFMDASSNKVNSRNLSDLKVEVFGNTAIARFSETYDALVQGQEQNRTVICTQTWNKEGAAWKMLATHCSRAI